MLFFFTTLLVLGCINGIMVVGLNLQYGYSGLLNFAFYTYVAIGAYIAGVTTEGPSTTPQITYILGWNLPWYLGLLLGGLVAAVLGAVVFSFTVRRLRSDYLAIVTVSAAFIAWNVINNFIPLFDGASGIFNVPYITGNLNISTQDYSLLILGLSAAILLVFVVLSQLIFRSPYGRLLRAIREDEVVTSAFGRTVWPPQLWMFMLGCFMAGIAGGIFVFYITAWSPTAFLPLIILPPGGVDSRRLRELLGSASRRLRPHRRAQRVVPLCTVVWKARTGRGCPRDAHWGCAHSRLAVPARGTHSRALAPLVRPPGADRIGLAVGKYAPRHAKS